jgi:SAM-dependent methyltransferase
VAVRRKGDHLSGRPRPPTDTVQAVLERLRAALRGGDEVGRRLQALEDAVAQSGPAGGRALDEVVHDAVELNATVLQRRLDALVGEIDSLRAEVRGGREHTEAAVEVAERKLVRRMDLLRRTIESGSPASAVGGSGERTTERAPGTAGDRSVDDVPTPAAPAIDAGLYVALEDRFRGEAALIADRQRAYLPHLGSLVDADHPVLDIGSGRGEWLGLLAQAEIPAVGVDSNPVSVAECREAGLQVVEADLTEHLAGLPDGSIGAVTMFQVVEHLPFPVLVSTLRAVARVLRPGGVLIAETPNALNLQVAATNFWIDPTHQRPLHPEVLVFLALESGFTDIERVFANRIGPDPTDLSDLPEAAAALLGRLSEAVDGPGDFCLVARTAPDA